MCITKAYYEWNQPEKNGTKYLLETENADNKLSGIVTERKEPKYTPCLTIWRGLWLVQLHQETGKRSAVFINRARNGS